MKTCLEESRHDEKKHDYLHPELDSDNKKFTKQIEKAVSVEEDNILSEDDNDDEVVVKQITNDEVKKENRLLIVLASIFAGLAIVVAVIIAFIPSFLNQKDIIVPDVSGKTVSEAITILQENGFEVLDKQEQIKTNPAAGSKRANGSSVTLYISIGDVKHLVEDYTGKSYDEVKGVLEYLGINVYAEKQEIDESMKDKYKDGNIIIGQDVPAGSKLGAGDNITLYLPDVSAQFPDFTDGTYSINEVHKFCKEHGVILDIKYQTGTSYDAGTIFKQSRNEGYTVESGTTFIIYVAEDAPDEELEEEPSGCNELEEAC